MRKKVIWILVCTLTILVVTGLFTGYQYFFAQADVATTAPTMPAKGLAVKVLANDGQTQLAGVKIGLIAIDADNASLRNAFGYDPKCTKKKDNSGAIILDGFGSSVIAANSPAVGIIGGIGGILLSGDGNCSGSIANFINHNVLLLDGENKVKTSQASVFKDSTINLPQNQSLHGYSLFDDRTFQFFSGSGNSLGRVWPIRIYAQLDDGPLIVNTLIKDGKNGLDKADLTYDPEKLNEVVLQLPVAPKTTADAEPGLAFLVLDLNNRPVANAQVSGGVKMTVKRSDNSIVETTFPYSGTTDSNGKFMLNQTLLLESSKKNTLTTATNNSAFASTLLFIQRRNNSASSSPDTISNQPNTISAVSIDMSSPIYINYKVTYGSNVISQDKNYFKKGDFPYAVKLYRTYPAGQASNGILPAMAEVVYLNTTTPTQP